MRETNLQKRLRLSGQRRKGGGMVKYFGSQGRRAFKKAGMVSNVSTVERGSAKFRNVFVDLVTRKPLMTVIRTDWMEWECENL